MPAPLLLPLPLPANSHTARLQLRYGSIRFEDGEVIKDVAACSLRANPPRRAKTCEGERPPHEKFEAAPAPSPRKRARAASEGAPGAAREALERATTRAHQNVATLSAALDQANMHLRALQADLRGVQ